MIKTADEWRETHNRALEIVRRIAEIDHPEIASEIDGSLSCFFCSAWLDLGDPHAADCIWLAARELVGDNV